MRDIVIAGNFKMNLLPNEVMDHIEKLNEQVKDSTREIIVCVPYIDIMYAHLAMQGTKIKLGAQNMHFEDFGAFTGEISAKMLKACKVDYVIIGHSERRQYFAETDETVNKKVKKALEVELKPIICVGETLEQREQAMEKEVLENQVEKALNGIDDLSNVIIAYEPIWAIGTGKTATKEEANDTIKIIRDKVSAMYNDDVAQKLVILYGGSVKPSNAKELLEMPEIDGFLVGGASLNPEEFAKIVNA